MLRILRDALDTWTWFMLGLRNIGYDYQDYLPTGCRKSKCLWFNNYSANATGYFSFSSIQFTKLGMLRWRNAVSSTYQRLAPSKVVRLCVYRIPAPLQLCLDRTHHTI